MDEETVKKYRILIVALLVLAGVIILVIFALGYYIEYHNPNNVDILNKVILILATITGITAYSTLIIRKKYPEIDVFKPKYLESDKFICNISNYEELSHHMDEKLSKKGYAKTNEKIEGTISSNIYYKLGITWLGTQSLYPFTTYVIIHCEEFTKDILDNITKVSHNVINTQKLSKDHSLNTIILVCVDNINDYFLNSLNTEIRQDYIKEFTFFIGYTPQNNMVYIQRQKDMYGLSLYKVYKKEFLKFIKGKITKL